MPAGKQRTNNDFEKNYLLCRAIEKRIYSDEEVKQLPERFVNQEHAKEWAIRKRSSQKMYQYLLRQKKVLNILEVGCGNGWFLKTLAGIPDSLLTGTDINLAELEQAERVFSANKRLRFMHGDIRSGILGDDLFDIIIFAASIPYFSSLNEIITRCFEHLLPGGEIHILDSRFYKPHEITEAKQRCIQYFTNQGLPEMAGYYFHHSLSDLAPFRYSILYDPESVFHKLSRNRSPFHWVCIKNENVN